MRTLILLLGFSLAASGAAFTASVTGNWNAAATWGGAGVPGDGDTATISNGVVVTITADVTVGDAANPTTHAIRTAGTGGTGRLIVNPGVTLTLHGNVLQGNATWEIGADSGGATVIFDHASTKLTWQIADANAQPNALLLIKGAAGNRSVIRKSVGGVVGGGFGNVATNFTDGGRLEASYVNFYGIGDASASDAAAFLKQRPNSAAYRLILDHVWLDACGRIPLTPATNTTLRWSYVKITNPVALSNRVISLSGAIGAIGTGQRLIEHSYFEGQVYLVPSSGSLDFTIRDSVFTGLAGVAPLYATGTGTNVSNVLLWNRETSGAASYLPTGSHSGIVSLRSDGGVNSDHIRINPLGDVTIDGFVSEFLSTGDDYLILNAAPTVLSTITVKHGIAIPSSATGSFVIPAFAGDYTNLRLVVEHNTVALVDSPTTSALIVSETSSGTEGTLTGPRSNIAWRITSGAAVLSNAITDPVSGLFVGADYNATYNITPRAASDLYLPAAAYQGTPGAHDIEANPLFVDADRKFLAWGQSITPALADWAAVIAEMGKVADDTGFDSRFTPSAAYTWIRAGFAPRNQLLKGTAHDGGDIGAVSVAANSGSNALMFSLVP